MNKKINIEIGNIIKIGDNEPVIVTDVTKSKSDNEYLIAWQDLNNQIFQLSGGIFPSKENRHFEICWNCYEETDEGPRHNEDCKICKGTGERVRVYGGLKNVKIVAKTLNSFQIRETKKEIKKLENKLKKLISKK